MNGATDEHAQASKAVADGLANFASQFIKLSNYVKLISGQSELLMKILHCCWIIIPVHF